MVSGFCSPVCHSLPAAPLQLSSVFIEKERILVSVEGPRRKQWGAGVFYIKPSSLSDTVDSSSSITNCEQIWSRGQNYGSVHEPISLTSTLSCFTHSMFQFLKNSALERDFLLISTKYSSIFFFCFRNPLKQISRVSCSSILKNI